ncbi:hypothetical protein GQ53DRAFT_316843 [Thozetella sp. PMI_491]|nr:hypothetical protein GQ53DRAFT_316843 [Thozetella sp. PMI_491]
MSPRSLLAPGCHCRPCAALILYALLLLGGPCPGFSCLSAIRSSPARDMFAGATLVSPKEVDDIQSPTKSGPPVTRGHHARPVAMPAPFRRVAASCCTGVRVEDTGCDKTTWQRRDWMGRARSLMLACITGRASSPGVEATCLRPKRNVDETPCRNQSCDGRIIQREGSSTRSAQPMPDCRRPALDRCAGGRADTRRVHRKQPE